MAHSNRLNITLSDDAVQFIRSKLANGEYSSESEVINESQGALKDRAEEREAWERNVLMPSHDRLVANPSSAIPLEKVKQHLEARRRERSQAN
jgi:Arc/MetJ-type ribon-helix-helix transcriptional regulator